MKKPSRSILQIAVLVDTSGAYGRGLVRGISRFATEHGPWSLYLEPRDLRSEYPDWLQHWPGHGILARSGTGPLLQRLEESGLPVVELRASRLPHPFPFVGVDNATVGAGVADYLQSRGYRNFGAYLDPSEEYFRQRIEVFQSVLAQFGYPCSVFGAFSDGERPRWDDHQNALARWLVELPKPAAVFACNDQLGFWLLDAARRAGVAVPGELAVIGAGNDEMLCNAAVPSLSSVDLPGDDVGYAAAKLLFEWIQSGKPQPPIREILLPPGQVVPRVSSDAVAITDARLSSALQYIREHAVGPLCVEEVARASSLSRSALERKMRATLARTPLEEIHRVRFGLVEKLLLQTDLTLEQIAERTGFEYPQYMAEAFRLRTGMTPGRFRARRKT
jgi:LacI family transcriptional regulator